MFPHHAQGAKQHAVHCDGEHGCKPNRHPHAQVAEAEEAVSWAHQPGHQREQSNQRSKVNPSKGIESKESIQEDLTPSNRLGQHEVHRSRCHLVANEAGRHEQGDENTDEKDHTQLADGENKASVDGLKGVGLVVRVLVHVAVAEHAKTTAVAVGHQFNVTGYAVPVGVLLGVRAALHVAVTVVVQTNAPFRKGVPIKVVFVDPYARVVGQHRWVQHARVGRSIVHVRSVEVFLTVRVAVPVPVVGISVVVNGLVIPGHGVDVEHGQHPHGGDANQQHDPRREALSLLAEGKFSNGEGFAVHAAPQTWKVGF